MDALFYSLEQLPLPFESSSVHNDCRWSSLLAVRSGDYNKLSNMNIALITWNCLMPTQEVRTAQFKIYRKCLRFLCIVLLWVLSVSPSIILWVMWLSCDQPVCLHWLYMTILHCFRMERQHWSMLVTFWRMTGRLWRCYLQLMPIQTCRTRWYYITWHCILKLL